MSAVFLSTFTPRLDDKGRLFLPAKYRDRLSTGLVITRGQDTCLYVYPMDEFSTVTEQMLKAPVSNKQARDFIRMFLSGASDEIPDKQGRITVPAHLRSYAGLAKDCTVVGAGTRLEVWDSARWADYNASVEEAYANQSEEVIPGLF